MTKPLNTAQRVEILLKVGIENPKKWATVHGYTDPVNPVTPGDPRAAEEWQRLRDHHLAETNFLFDVIREMREQILSQQESIESLQESCNAKTVSNR
jgi:hypothetical protein